MKNSVEFLDFNGGDKKHCLSAWCSTFDELGIEIPEKIEDRIDAIFEHIKKTKKKTPAELLEMLATHEHGTPFEKSSLHFFVTSDIATHIHLLKHRIGVSLNSESCRYKELVRDKYYVPMDWPEEEVQKHIEYCEHAYSEYHRVLKKLTQYYQDKGMSKRTARSRAKESARFKLPYSTQLSCDVQFNFRSFYHFVKLRYSTHAQKEVREVAKQMLLHVIQLPDFYHTLRAFELIDAEGNLRKPFS